MSFRLTVDYESELPSLKGGDAEKCVNLEVSELISSIILTTLLVSSTSFTHSHIIVFLLN